MAVDRNEFPTRGAFGIVVIVLIAFVTVFQQNRELTSGFTKQLVTAGRSEETVAAAVVDPNAQTTASASSSTTSAPSRSPKDDQHDSPPPQKTLAPTSQLPTNAPSPLNPKTNSPTASAEIVDLESTSLLWKYPLSQGPSVKANATFLISSSSGSDDCVCDLISVDCLNSVRCLPKTRHDAQQTMALGILIRQRMKEKAEITSEDEGWGNSPVGKGLQYVAIAAWKQWIHENKLPSHFRRHRSIFVNETLYKPCEENDYNGKTCFFDNVNAVEDVHELEEVAMKAESKPLLPKEIPELIEADLVHFRNQSNHQDGARPPALAYLLSFAHISRIRFNLRPHMKEIYKQRLQSVIHVARKDTEEDTPLRVTLHLRRADACGHQQKGYETEGSKLDSPAQTSGKRKCYATSVYLNALNRTRELAGKKVVDVYLATDHAGSVMEEIETDFKELYDQVNWYFLDYFSENTFKYDGFVEGNGMDKAKQARLGESAVADLFHASHGEVFIGHLGSRFGKVSWLLMTARNNRFVPFFSPDGHSYCCEIDEACAEVREHITDMENCMTFSHEMARDIPMNRSPEGYWEVGSRKRQEFVKRQRKKTTQ